MDEWKCSPRKTVAAVLQKGPSQHPLSREITPLNLPLRNSAQFSGSQAIRPPSASPGSGVSGRRTLGRRARRCRGLRDRAPVAHHTSAPSRGRHTYRSSRIRPLARSGAQLCRSSGGRAKDKRSRLVIGSDRIGSEARIRAVIRRVHIPRLDIRAAVLADPEIEWFRILRTSLAVVRMPACFQS
jgi:hypothetical protein